MNNNPFRQLSYLRADIRRWKYSSIKDAFYIIFEQGLWVAVFYRISRTLYLINIPIIKIVLRFIAFIILKFCEVFLGTSIKPCTNIGPGLYIGHVGSIIIHPQAEIGKNLNIGPGVVIGEKGVGKGGVPTIGNDVYIGVGAKIIGDIKIGNNVKVGANAVVIKDAPDNATVGGVPAKILNKEFT